MTAMNMEVRFTRSKVSRWLYCTGPFRSMVRLRLGKHCENYIFKEWKAGTNSKMCSNKSGGKQNGSTSKEKSFLPEDTIVWLDWVVLKSEVPWAFTNQVPCQRIVWWTTGLPWWLSVKNLPLMQETTYSAGDLGSIPGWEDPLEKEMATHSGIPAWEISRTEEAGRQQCTRLLESDMTEQLNHHQSPHRNVRFDSNKELLGKFL